MLKKKYTLQQDIMTSVSQVESSRSLVKVLQSIYLMVTPNRLVWKNRLAAIIRTPSNRGIAKLVKKIITSPRFDLKRLPDLPISFMVVDGIQVVYETINFINPDQFTLAVSKYDDYHLANNLSITLKCYQGIGLLPDYCKRQPS